jgi:hypothetical protein
MRASRSRLLVERLEDRLVPAGNILLPDPASANPAVLGLCAGLSLPEGITPFYAQRLHQARLFVDDFAGYVGPFAMVQIWVTVMILAVTPLMVGLFTFAKAVEVVVETMARSARRTERTVQRALQQRFDTHL